MVFIVFPCSVETQSNKTRFFFFFFFCCCCCCASPASPVPVP